ncbi:actin-like ATPase domain-containing protein [Aspergillus ellipticus CBS 707.79]|uniref:Actin-like ATPase domain-containing protein n=1 Tax=Aspergillus ellipticus CBS 707.79 TaxID=1448320 RepID=A0A319DN70_9EURO|nr:actin-like ATPase domain-containing protein [Aspergillus ellipticus CBS 707.79]
MGRIIIGLDFGTTYSGVAWVLDNCPDEPEVITSWPGRGNRTSPKVPSIVSYSNGKFLWGYQATLFGENIRGIKLLLDVSQSEEVASALSSVELLKQNQKTAVQVAGTYLKQLVYNANQTLDRRFGTAVKSMDRQYILTTPAVWSDKAKDATLTAAVNAGIARHEIALISEPEAAALYCMHAIQPNTIRNGDVVVVCDAGGGTVDLISYCVKTVSPLSLEEVVEGSGGICGSMVLDVRFNELLDELIGKNKIPINSREMALKFWQEDIKPNFANDLDDKDETHFIPLPGVKDNRKISLRDGFLKLDGSRHYLIQDQVHGAQASKNTVMAILLVGGSGSSEYLFQRIKKAHRGITVMQPPNSWSAVMLGAVQHGIEGNRVGKRIARRHYGVQFRSDSSAYNGRFPDVKREWCRLNETWYLPGVMNWYIHKGGEISEGSPICMPFSRSIAVENASTMIFSDPLLVCNRKSSPERVEDTVFQICTLETDLSRVPAYLFDLRKNSCGQKFYKVN